MGQLLADSRQPLHCVIFVRLVDGMVQYWLKDRVIVEHPVSLSHSIGRFSIWQLTYKPVFLVTLMQTGVVSSSFSLGIVISGWGSS